ncbi:ChrR family anti-sigma-E factor [Frigidibacter albus]|uniref:Anti-ECFsigma factor n=2 Tax=Frigidibacter mobilis TaxID=1335048 RepID=A0A159Z7I8_9RHOB|nr:anti-ECFsigma factor [Frigidibacter mobilis]
MNAMTIQHHLTDELLMGYAAGTLPEAFNLVVATHLSLCDECRARAEAFDALGGSLLGAMETADLAEDSLQATLRRIAAGPQTARPQDRPRTRKPGELFPAPLQDYVGGDLAAVRWRPVGMGVRQAILRSGPGATARLLYIPAGSAVPDHSHRGRELTLVLQGAFQDEDGRFGPGDIEIADQAVQHTPTAEPGQPCICLAATDAPLRFRSLIPRLAQPFFRI